MVLESQLYRDLMRLKPEGWSPNAWAVRAGVSRTVWTDMRRHGNPSRRTLEKLLTAAGSSLAEFEALRVGGTPHDPAVRQALGDAHGSAWRGAAVPSLPLLATSPGGRWQADGAIVDVTEVRRGEIIERLPRPLSLAGDSSAYALTVAGDQMWPRFRPGRRVAVSPQASVASGDDVLATFTLDEPAGHALVAIFELAGRTASDIKLRQFNPDLTFRIGVGALHGLHKVMGELI